MHTFSHMHKHACAKGDPLLMDRVERLAFNAMPAALTADMWTHVYVQQSNSVFAGRTAPSPSPPPMDTPASAKQQKQQRSVHNPWAPKDRSLTAHHLDTRHGHSNPSGGCSACGQPPSPSPSHSHSHSRSSDGGSSSSSAAVVGDKPSGEDQGSNFFGVSHFPCCITNFPQGWPKFAMHTILAAPTNAFVVASLVPSKATLPSTVGGGTTVAVDSKYPFGDTATITVTAKTATTALVRIPGWADAATVNGGKAGINGTFFKVACSAGSTTIKVALNPEIRVEYGWGAFGTKAESSVMYAAGSAPTPVPSADYDNDYLYDGTGTATSKVKGFVDIRSGSPGQNTTATIMHPLIGEGHYITDVDLTFKYIAGYAPSPGYGALYPTRVFIVDSRTQVCTTTPPQHHRRRRSPLARPPSFMLTCAIPIRYDDVIGTRQRAPCSRLFLWIWKPAMIWRSCTRPRLSTSTTLTISKATLRPSTSKPLGFRFQTQKLYWSS